MQMLIGQVDARASHRHRQARSDQRYGSRLLAYAREAQRRDTPASKEEQVNRDELSAENHTRQWQVRRPRHGRNDPRQRGSARLTEEEFAVTGIERGIN